MEKPLASPANKKRKAGTEVGLSAPALSLHSRFIKRTCDIICSVLGLVLTGWLIALFYLLATLDTRQSGIFTQVRIGRFGKPFRILKVRTMRGVPDLTTSVTTASDCRITRLGRFCRRTNIDELPQLINVLAGHMSMVGPRPDVRGFADQLMGEDRIILAVRPGITGPATLHYVQEEEDLAQQDEPETYNREVIYPVKVRLNREYVENYSLLKDLRYIYMTLIHVLRAEVPSVERATADSASTESLPQAADARGRAP